MKLTLRDLFWLVLVCAMALGWWLERASRHQVLYIVPIETGWHGSLSDWD